MIKKPKKITFYEVYYNNPYGSTTLGYYRLLSKAEKVVTMWNETCVALMDRAYIAKRILE
jgi:hypothetical protein